MDYAVLASRSVMTRVQCKCWPTNGVLRMKQHRRDCRIDKDSAIAMPSPFSSKANGDTNDCTNNDTNGSVCRGYRR